jgi:uncharacterized protein YutE (UPF0331/DUF86 family)
MDDVILQKAAIIERCLRRVRDEHAGDDARLDDITRLDAIVLNLQRACEAAIDLAMHRVRVHRLGVPQESREAFAALARAGLLDPDLATAMQRMVGFRNIAVHDYQALSLDIVKAILGGHLGELERFAADMTKASAESR